MTKARTVKKVVKSGNTTTTTTKRGGRTTTTRRTVSGGGLGGKSKGKAPKPKKEEGTPEAETEETKQETPKQETPETPQVIETETVSQSNGMSAGENFLTLLLLLACIGVYLNYRAPLMNWWKKYVLTKPAAPRKPAATAPTRATTTPGTAPVPSSSGIVSGLPPTTIIKVPSLK